MKNWLIIIFTILFALAIAFRLIQMIVWLYRTYPGYMGAIFVLIIALFLLGGLASRKRYHHSVDSLIQISFGQVKDEVEKFTQEYPFIEFSQLSVQDVIEMSGSMQARCDRKLSPCKVVLKIYEIIINKMNREYLSAEKIYPSREQIKNNLVPSEFWRNEKNCKINSDDGQNPQDWRYRRVLVHARDQGNCRRCGANISLIKCHIHHLKLRSQGGDHDLNNLVTLCRDCHSLMEGGKHYKIREYIPHGKRKPRIRRLHFDRSTSELLRRIEVIISSYCRDPRCIHTEPTVTVSTPFTHP